ncbi:hypothetical protein CEUSTIGMA_g11794.t1 [Chlamydomonas eustigma]|uniref:DNA-binding protein RHL1 n=1 Tax=Chlamydomonas eustigma TaxID=1157962 RepID=A0A250XN82_9CHLO|nr:hypothetical protein CEUSTIGMA_g11794.t1 [Chlamydomonas eustigma]|eukprot:GAX84372.1 hypothetical protein CEUSTIGMA_g11794.t1 [Chlamydomonas eustigma]
MPPKEKKLDNDHVSGPAHKGFQIESKRLKDKALKTGLLTEEKFKQSEQLLASKALTKCNGYDIVKKSSARKSRYLVVINAQLAPAAAGRMGTLSNLDSKNPVMYLEFPQGRIKMLGTLLFPRSRYITLKSGSGQLLCEDVFESLLVFSEAWWVGGKDENPEEKRLPMPPELYSHKSHQGYHFTYGAQAACKKADAKARAVGPIETEDQGIDSQVDPDSQPVKRQRRSSVYRSYVDVGDGVNESDEEKDDLKPKIQTKVNKGASKHVKQSLLSFKTKEEMKDGVEGVKRLEGLAGIVGMNLGQLSSPSGIIINDSDEDAVLHRPRATSTMQGEGRRSPASVRRSSIDLVTDSGEDENAEKASSDKKQNLKCGMQRENRKRVSGSKVNRGDYINSPLSQPSSRKNPRGSTRVFALSSDDDACHASGGRRRLASRPASTVAKAKYISAIKETGNHEGEGMSDKEESEVGDDDDDDDDYKASE